MGEDVPNRPESAPGYGLAFAPFGAGKRRHAAKQSFDGPPYEPDMAIPLDPESDPKFVRPGTLHPRSRESFWIAARIGDTVRLERAKAAARLLRPTDRRAEVHHCLDEIARTIRRDHQFGEFPDFVPGLMNGVFRAIVETMVAGNHPSDVRIDRCGGLAKSNRCYRRGGIVADPWQLPQLRDTRGKGASRGDLASASDQVARPRVVAE